ncbi:acyl carrier protein [Paenibacillus sp. 1781tsa1]|uniref:acyl carrier protein n=1 Tax=Paenibacillus sp. 1781tsa1 TaxID=2953810 RepID=UPI0020A06EC6|nr:acyl carrier protein [Paenibacillus sp. 1781tsa1]MCP1185192.1 acyl carrier protein [Paenibacillus sp. 1781tsa1]
MEQVSNSMIEAKIIQIIHNILGYHLDIPLDERLENLGFNSIKYISLIVSLEEEFEIIFRDEDLLYECFATVEQIEWRISGMVSSA